MPLVTFQGKGLEVFRTLLLRLLYNRGLPKLQNSPKIFHHTLMLFPDL